MRSKKNQYLKAAFLVATMALFAAPVQATGPFIGLDALIDELSDSSRINPEFVIIPAQNGRFEHGPPHNQYHDVCWIFATQTASDYLGFSGYEPFSHCFIMADTLNNGGLQQRDVGYWGSPEHVMVGGVDFVHNTPAWNLAARYYTEAAKTYACPTGNINPDYGECHAGSTFWGGYQGVNDSGDGFDYIGAFVDFFETNPIVGCGDYKNFPAFGSDRDDWRKIIKAFVDNNTPFVVNVACKHNTTIIGYADIGPDGLPNTAIGTDAHTTVNNEPRFYLYENLDQSASWRVSNDYHSICNVRPRNQHLNGGCLANGWATELDSSLADPDHRVCPMDPGVTLDCGAGDRNVRFYGITVECWDNGVLKEDFHATPENPFITVPRNIGCDDIIVRYADGTYAHDIQSAHARRYAYNSSTDAWEQFSAYTGTTSTHFGNCRTGYQHEVTFYNWPTNWVLVADGLGGTYTKRRTTVELEFTDNQKFYIEISPPETYGIQVECHNNGSVTWSSFIEADHNKSMYLDGGNLREQQNVMVDPQTHCDDVRLQIALGGLKSANTATVTRFGYHDTQNEWKKMNSTAPWQWDSWRSMIATGLTGIRSVVTWDDIWPENYRFVGHGYTGTYPERKTVFEIGFNDGSTREIVVAPF